MRIAGDDPFWAEVQEDYDAVVPHPDNGPPPEPEEVEGWADEFRASGFFDIVEERRHLFPITYTAESYVAVLGTFSDNLVLPAEQRPSSSAASTTASQRAPVRSTSRD